MYAYIYDTKREGEQHGKESSKGRCGGGAEYWSAGDKSKQGTVIHMYLNVLRKPTVSCDI